VGTTGRNYQCYKNQSHIYANLFKFNKLICLRIIAPKTAAEKSFGHWRREVVSPPPPLKSSAFPAENGSLKRRESRKQAEKQRSERNFGHEIEDGKMGENNIFGGNEGEGVGGNSTTKTRDPGGAII
jgi:hypothetical protein